MTQTYDTLIIGAGASGLHLASRLQEQNIAILDSAESVGKKLEISGGGKCNITNATVSSENYLGEPEFVQSVLGQFDNHDLLAYLKSHAIETSLQKRVVEGQYFLRDAKILISHFLRHIPKNSLFLGHKVLAVTKPDDFLITTDKGEFRAKRVVVASGGASYPALGASDIALSIAKSFGHESSAFRPALVGWTVMPSEYWFKELSGVSMEVVLRVGEKVFQGNILFTHKGVSGPVVLNGSLYWTRGQVSIDFAPDPKIYQPKSFKKLFTGNLHDYRFAPAGNFGLTRAEVCAGGVATSQIEANTMESKLVEGLYFIGEALDVTGELGGYNLQWAISSAEVCAQNLVKSL